MAQTRTGSGDGAEGLGVGTTAQSAGDKITSGTSIAGIRGKTLIVNLPGRPKAIRENLEAVFPAIPYCIDLLGGPFLTTNEAIVTAFRPKK